MKGTVVGTKNLKSCVLGPSGLDKVSRVSCVECFTSYFRSTCKWGPLYCKYIPARRVRMRQEPPVWAPPDPGNKDVFYERDRLFWWAGEQGRAGTLAVWSLLQELEV